MVVSINQMSGASDRAECRSLTTRDTIASTNLIHQSLTDIALLFGIFKDPRHTTAAFGFPTFADFVSALNDSDSQRQWLEAGVGMKVLFHEFRTDRIEIISSTLEGADIGVSEIDWDMVRRLEWLTHLVMIKSNISGVVSFDKLPKKLSSLYLRDNQITGIVNPGQCPFTLQYLDLSNNPLVEAIYESDFERRSWFEVFNVTAKAA